jgi:hypothetical protein
MFPNVKTGRFEIPATGPSSAAWASLASSVAGLRVNIGFQPGLLTLTDLDASAAVAVLHYDMDENEIVSVSSADAFVPVSKITTAGVITFGAAASNADTLYPLASREDNDSSGDMTHISRRGFTMDLAMVVAHAGHEFHYIATPPNDQLYEDLGELAEAEILEV